ncbi:hypothetical protein [uncultured Cohaesibacter sp.]|uniref:hypothetical protein n=1 Tax=uncultured Cohaesibacter sp. TaxID=1002546 RepID=UPI0029C8C576|nr:hypothetical protein [uncultured Cohaesibacter sp.]
MLLIDDLVQRIDVIQRCLIQIERESLHALMVCFPEGLVVIHADKLEPKEMRDHVGDGLSEAGEQAPVLKIEPGGKMEVAQMA